MAPRGLWKREQRRLLAELDRLGISQSALARQVGVTRQAIGNWLTSERCPTAENYLELLHAIETLKAEK